MNSYNVMLLICDHPLKTAALKQILLGIENVQLFVHSSLLEQDIEYFKTKQIVIILIDLDDIEGQEHVLVLIKRHLSSSQVIIITDDLFYYSCISEEDISGVLPKKSNSEQIISLINAVKTGTTIIPISIFNEIQSKANENNLLTIEEKQLLSLVTKGYTNVQIAKEIFVSTRTVEKYLNKIYEKLNVRNRIEAVEKITREKILLLK